MTNPPTSPAPAPAVARGAGESRFAGLDGLRAVAVCVVLLFHLSPGFMPGGFLGVDVFFVLSGFLITALLLREKARHGRIRLANFWRRRARRLLPALGTLLLVCCSAAWLIGGDVLVGLGRQVLGAVTFGSNWLAIADGHSYFGDTAPELFRNLWSLAVEEQFYLLWPLAVLLLLLVRCRRIRLALVGAGAVASALAMALAFDPGADATRVYYGTDTHSFGLALGAVLAILAHDWPGLLERSSQRMRAVLQWAGAGSVVALLAASVLLTAQASITYHGGLAAVAVLTVVAIAGSIVPGSRLGRYLDVAPLRWLGERSYGLYLWHWPVFVLLAAAAPGWSRSGAPGWALGGVALAISLGAAAASYRYVEQPIRINGFRAVLRAAAWARSSRMRFAGVGAVVLLAAGGGISTATAIVNDPGVSDAQAEIEHGQAALSAPRMLTAPSLSIASSSWVSRSAVPSVPPPVLRSLPSGSEITAIGDSVMLASAPELQSAFPGIQIDAVVSRQLAEAPKLMRGMLRKGTLRDTVLLGLGTNGPIDEKTLEDIRRLATPARHIVVVNVQAPRGWTPRVNESLMRFAQRYRGVELANWRDAISGHLRYLARDQIHPGPRGGRIYVTVVEDALQRLAESQVYAPNGYRLAPIPH